MNGRLQDYRLLWRAAVSHANPFASWIVRIGVPLLALLAAAAQQKLHGAGAALAWGWGEHASSCCSSGLFVLCRAQ